MIFGFSVFGTTCFSDFTQTNPNLPEQHWDLVCFSSNASISVNIEVSNWNDQNSAVSNFAAVSAPTPNFATIAQNSSTWNESSSLTDQIHSSC